MEIKKYKDYGEEIEKRLMLKSFPLAIKLIESEEEIPEEADRPLKDYGYHLSLCQAYQIARREGTTIAMLKEDMWCFEPVVGYGLEEPPEGFMEGYNRYPHDVKSLEAGQHYAEEFPKFEIGRYKGTVFTSLKSTSFEPDLIMIYCDSEQLNLLLLARECEKGYNLNCALSSHAGCVYGVVPPMQEKKCQVAVPCRGDRYRAQAESDEMIFTVPREKISDLVEGLRYVEKSGSRLPYERTVKPEYELPESYREIGNMMEYLKEEKEDE